MRQKPWFDAVSCGECFKPESKLPKVGEKISRSFYNFFQSILILSHRLRFFAIFISATHRAQKKGQLSWCGTRSYCAEALIGVTPRLHGSTPHASQHAIHQLLTVQELLGKRVVDYAQSVSHRWIIHFFAPKYALCNKRTPQPTQDQHTRNIFRIQTQRQKRGRWQMTLQKKFTHHLQPSTRIKSLCPSGHTKHPSGAKFWKSLWDSNASEQERQPLYYSTHCRTKHNTMDSWASFQAPNGHPSVSRHSCGPFPYFPAPTCSQTRIQTFFPRILPLGLGHGGVGWAFHAFLSRRNPIPTSSGGIPNSEKVS